MVRSFVVALLPSFPNCHPILYCGPPKWRTILAKESNNVFPELGMAAAAFACFLVVVSISSPSDQLRRAVAFFAVCIPIVIAGAFLARLRENGDPNWLKAVLMTLRLACVAVGDVGCGIGIYWVFAHVSETSANRFLTTALLCWFTLALLDLAIKDIRRRNSRKSEVTKSET